MGGCGKTTLATKVYNDPSIVHHFHARAWCPVSQTLDKKALLLELLNQIRTEKYSEMTEDDLAEKLRHGLKGMRYLIFLDDTWTIEAWNSLKGSFPDDSNGSRIILTSRNRNTTSVDMLDQEPHSLRPLTQDESLELLRRKLLPEDDNWPRVIYNLAVQIAGKCQGLPLAIVIVAGLLTATKQEGWKEIVDSLSSRVVSSMDQYMELSYQHLPDYLKPCLLYFGTFPEDKEVSVRRLIRIWIAEGFVRKDELKSLEDVEEDYMKDLIGRSLIMVANQRSMGGVKSCRIHDLLHDFCLQKAKDKYFFHLLKGQDELLAFNEPFNLRRLCIHAKSELQLKKSMLFCPRARSLRFFSQETGRYKREVSLDMSFVINIFKLVRVLDLGGIYWGNVFPSEIELLIQLRYLAIRGSFKVIPSSVGNLSMLETFIVDPCGQLVTLPDTIWNLQKLKYVFIGGRGGTFRFKSLDNNYVLYELERISGVVFICTDSMEEQMRKFPNIRKLKCCLCMDWVDVILDFLGRLESLHMSPLDAEPLKNIDFCLPANLRKLTLSDFRLPWSEISTIGKLASLEVLKLLRDSFEGEIWEMEEGEFPKLKYLKLSLLGIVRWTATSDDQFPCLEKLVLDGCVHLEEMPCDCLGSSTPTLERIEAFICSDATRSLLKQIEEQQVSFGNSSLKLIFHSFDNVYPSDDDYE